MNAERESGGRFFAHSDGGADDAAWQLLSEHLSSTAELAARFAEPFSGQRIASLAGVLHDVGKYTVSFQERLAGAPERVDHSTAGAFLLERGELRPVGRVDQQLARLAAYAIAGHHAGLADWSMRTDAPTGGALSDRLAQFDPAELKPSWRREIAPAPSGLTPPGFEREGGADPGFALSVLCRMVFSCLVDADFKDTERYFAQVEGRVVDRSWPTLQEILPELRERLAERMTAVCEGESEGSQRDALFQQRSRIHRAVRSRASEAPGFFTLTVPTGGGKTLTSLGFALDHAMHHGLRRIICAIPFTSIIDQTAELFRAVLGEDRVLEHHSNLQDGAAPRTDGLEGRRKLDLADGGLGGADRGDDERAVVRESVRRAARALQETPQHRGERDRARRGAGAPAPSSRALRSGHA